MSCSCNCNPCNCNPAPVTCCTPTTESVEYTFENANVTGVGVFDNDTDDLVQFRGIVSDSASLTVTLDAGNKTILISFDPEALVADIPDATTTQRGILETATNAEAVAKAATDKIVTPSNFSAMAASDTFAGLVELATNAETQSGISTTLAVTPAGLGYYATNVLNSIPVWTDSVGRGATAAVRAGQFGTETSTGSGWLAYGTAAGEWNQVFQLGTGSSYSNNSINFNTRATIGAGAFLSFDGAGAFNFECQAIFQGIIDLNFNGAAELYNNQVIVPANSVLITGASNGQFSSSLQSNFISTANTQTGWGTPNGTLARTTFTSYGGQTISNPPTQAEVQAMDDALVIVSQRLAAFITDIKAVKLPAT